MDGSVMNEQLLHAVISSLMKLNQAFYVMFVIVSLSVSALPALYQRLTHLFFS